MEPLELPKSLVHQLSASLVSVYTGGSRGASDLLKEQSEQIRDVQKSKLAEMVGLVGEGIKALYREDLKDFGELMHHSWSLKKKLTNKISNAHVDKIYDIGMQSGAWGGNLLGAGMGGFITFITSPDNVSELKSSLSQYRLIDLLPEKSGTKFY